MRDFQKEMERKKEEWKKKMKKMEKNKIKWEWLNPWEKNYNGTYEGNVKDEKPHGVGKWKWDGGNWTVEGEWKNGLLNGKAVENHWSGGSYEYEAKDGKYDGKFIEYYNDGSRR